MQWYAGSPQYVSYVERFPLSSQFPPAMGAEVEVPWAQVPPAFATKFQKCQWIPDFQIFRYIW
jgi:hypothetical protein